MNKYFINGIGRKLKNKTNRKIFEIFKILGFPYARIS